VSILLSMNVYIRSSTLFTYPPRRRPLVTSFAVAVAFIIAFAAVCSSLAGYIASNANTSVISSRTSEREEEG
jgi:hypothetical protein